jgi:DNA-binding MurR/RpiR family transcriptional regulator
MATFIERIRAARPDFSPSFLRLAEFLLDDYAQAAFLTATELAHRLDIDPATVVRFSQRLGYAGYPSLQQDIRRLVTASLLRRPSVDGRDPISAQAVFDELAASLDLTRRAFSMDAAQALIMALDKATRVILIGDRLGLSAAELLAVRLEQAGYTIQRVNPAPEFLAAALAGAQRSDLLLAVELEGQSPACAKALALGRTHDLATAAIVAAPSCSSASQAEWVLAAYPAASPEVNLALLAALLAAFLRVLEHARPGRFQQARERAQAFASTLSQDEH